MQASRERRTGFTLIELLVVIVIILLVSAATLPTVIDSMRERQVLSAAQLIQASLVGARDAATAANSPRGIRLVPDSTPARLADGTIDPAKPLVCSKVVPIEIPPAYQEGRVSIVSPASQYPQAITNNRPCLVLEQSPGHWEPTGNGFAWVPNPPTSWSWNIRIGEKVIIGVGSEFTVCGPMTVAPSDGNPEGFINYGPPGTGSGLGRTLTSPDGLQSVDVEPDVLLLVNGHDDDGTDDADEGWDGIDNDLDGTADELDEWEAETWLGVRASNVADTTYRIRRRPAPSPGRQPIDLANPAVVDLTGWDAADGRSRCVVDRYSGAVTILVEPDGSLVHDSPYSGRAIFGLLRGSFVHLWIGSRADMADAASPMPPPKEDARLLTISKAGLISVLTVDPDDPARVYLDARRGAR